MIKVTANLMKKITTWEREGHSIYFMLEHGKLFSESSGLLSKGDNLEYLKLDVGDNAICGKAFYDNEELKCNWMLEIHKEKMIKYYNWYLEEKAKVEELEGDK